MPYCQNTAKIILFNLCQIMSHFCSVTQWLPNTHPLFCFIHAKCTWASGPVRLLSLLPATVFSLTSHNAQSLLTCCPLSEDFTWPLFKSSMTPKHSLHPSSLLYISQHLHSYNIYFTCLFLFTSKNISSSRAGGSVCCVYCRITST